MKSDNWKFSVLLMFPLLALMAFGLLLLRPTPVPPNTLLLAAVTVKSTPPRLRGGIKLPGPDTRLKIKVGINRPLTVTQSLFGSASLRVFPAPAYLTDASGRKYLTLKDPVTRVGTRITPYAVGMPLNGSSYLFSYDFDLSQVPKSRGRITFHTSYVFVANKFTLPVSVVLRK